MCPWWPCFGEADTGVWSDNRLGHCLFDEIAVPQREEADSMFSGTSDAIITGRPMLRGMLVADPAVVCTSRAEVNLPQVLLMFRPTIYTAESSASMSACCVWCEPACSPRSLYLGPWPSPISILPSWFSTQTDLFTMPFVAEAFRRFNFQSNMHNAICKHESQTALICTRCVSVLLCWTTIHLNAVFWSVQC